MIDDKYKLEKRFRMLKLVQKWIGIDHAGKMSKEKLSFFNQILFEDMTTLTFDEFKTQTCSEINIQEKGSYQS